MISICIKENNLDVQNFIIASLNKCSFPEISYIQKQFKIYKNLIIHYSGEESKKFYSSISRIIVKSILKIYEPIIIKKMIDHDYFYFTEEEINIIMDEYKLLSKKKDRKIKENLLTSVIEEYISNNKSIFLEGFTRFRLYKYQNYISFKLQEAINQFVVDKEFFEFVNLLKSYVESKIPDDVVINLIYVNSKARLLSEDGSNIRLESFSSIYLSDISFSNNDYVLNTLVGILPKKIIIHTLSADDQFIKTIKLIFTNKVFNCNGCKLCNSYNLNKEQKIKKNKT